MGQGSRFLVSILLVDASAAGFCSFSLFDTCAMHVQTHTKASHILYDRRLLVDDCASFHSTVLHDWQV